MRDLAEPDPNECLRDDDPVLVHTRSMRNGLPEVLGVPGQTEGLWSVEGDSGSDLSLGG